MVKDCSKFKKSLVYAMTILTEWKFKNYICELWLYGSVARGDMKETSDVDLFLVLDNEAKLKIPSNELRNLTSLVIPVEITLPEVDLHFAFGCDWKNDRDVYYKEILKDGVRLWGN